MFTHREASEKIDSFRGAASRERKRERGGSCRIWGIEGQYFQEDPTRRHHNGEGAGTFAEKIRSDPR